MKVHVLITGLPGISKYLILYLKVFTFWPLSENFKQQNLYSITSLVNSKHLRTVTQDIKIIEDEIYPNLWLPVFTCVGTLKESSFICPLLCYRLLKCCSFYSSFSFWLDSTDGEMISKCLYDQLEIWSSLFLFLSFFFFLLFKNIGVYLV